MIPMITTITKTNFEKGALDLDGEKAEAVVLLATRKIKSIQNRLLQCLISTKKKGCMIT